MMRAMLVTPWPGMLVRMPRVRRGGRITMRPYGPRSYKACGRSARRGYADSCGYDHCDYGQGYHPRAWRGAAGFWEVVCRAWGWWGGGCLDYAYVGGGYCGRELAYVAAGG